MSRKNKQFLQSAILNNQAYLKYYNRLMEIALSSFEWENMPAGIDTRFLELQLFDKGKAIFFYDEVLEDYLTLPFADNGRWNIYNIPFRRRAYATNGYQRELTAKDSVICWNNQTRTNTRMVVQDFAYRLYNIDRIIDVNVNAQKTPQLVECEEEQRLTVENAMKEYDGNIPIIYANKGFSDRNKLTTLSSQTPFVSPQLYELKQKIWSEVLSYFGIACATLKKERLVSEEAMQTVGDIFINRKTRLKPREKFCEEVNRMFGLNISVRFDDNIWSEEMVLERLGGGQNG